MAIDTPTREEQIRNPAWFERVMRRIIRKRYLKFYADKALDGAETAANSIPGGEPLAEALHFARMALKDLF